MFRSDTATDGASAGAGPRGPAEGRLVTVDVEAGVAVVDTSEGRQPVPVGMRRAERLASLVGAHVSLTPMRKGGG